jgi:hypothetical protein
MSNEYETLRKILRAEQRRREGVYRFRPAERGPAMAEIAEGLAALERLRKAGEWKAAGKWWTEKFDE